MTATAPVFFLSYARTPGPHGSDADQPVFSFYDDLRKQVARLTRVKAQDAGHVDTPDAPSGAWQSALAACRVFVPLYAPRYFTDPLCGRQWTAFKRRGGRHYGRAVVPVLWVPPTDGTTLPPAALEISTHLPRAGGAEERRAQDRYAEAGLYRLMELEDDQRAYRQVLARLAERVARAAKDSPARPADAGQWGDRHGLEDAFAPQRSKPTLRITALAPTAGRLPPGREAATYGPDTEAWRPFRTASGSLIQQALALAGNLGFEPELVAFEKAYESIVHEGPGREPARPVAPWVLVVDAWALGDPRTSDMVRRIDRANRPWLAVMAVLAGDDPQTQRDRKRLTDRLRDTLSWHRQLDDVRHTARGAAAQGIAQPDAFAWLFAELAKSCYLRYLDSIQDDSPRPTPARRGVTGSGGRTSD